MADAYGGWAGSKGKWRCHIHYGIQSEDANSAVVYCQTRFQTNAWGFDTAGISTAVVNGSSASSGRVNHYSGTGASVDTTKVTKTVTITKKSSAQTISVSGTVQLVGGYQDGTSSASGTVTVGAIPVTKPGTPSGVTATKESDNVINVSWTLVKPSQGSITKNGIDVQIDDEWVTLSHELSATATSYTYSLAEPNHRYQFRVNSASSAGWGDIGYSNYAYTTPAPVGDFIAVTYDNITCYLTVISPSTFKYIDSWTWEKARDISSNNTQEPEDAWIPCEMSEMNMTSFDESIANLGRPYTWFRCRVAAPDGLSSEYLVKRASSVPRIWINSDDPIKAVYVHNGISAPVKPLSRAASAEDDDSDEVDTQITASSGKIKNVYFGSE